MSAKPITTKNGHVPGKTDRQDLWWVEPVITAGTLILFGIYTVWVAMSKSHYEFTDNGANYLSPMYSVPWFGVHAQDLIDKLPFGISPAFLWLWIPLGFRATCYYYRKSYYRAFFWDPPACAVPELKRSYKGETTFPLILQNLHRYFWYLAVFITIFLWIDAIKSFFFDGRLGIGVGSLVMLANVVLLSYYTFSCHAWRHIAGGCLNCMSKSKVRHTLWERISHINEKHGFWAWTSMMAVWFTDFYIRMCSMGYFTDFNISF